ncbi:MAG: DUF1501 domain-containing protein, partial [Dehalococcoidia bacterium]
IRNGLVALSVGAAAPHFLIRSAHATSRAAEALKAQGAKSLIVVEMAGGNDGINTLIPYADESYYQVRPQLAIQRQDALSISDSIALHPSMGALKELYDIGRLAVVQGVGYPNFDFSHFRAMEIYRSADTGPYTGIGWLGRYLDSIVSQVSGQPFMALVAGQPGISPTMRGEVFQTPAVTNPQAYQLTTDPRYDGDRANRLNAFNALNQTGEDNRAMLPILEETANTAYASSRELQELVSAYASSVEYPATGLGNSLKLMAQVVTADVGLQVGYVTIGGFDTHADQTEAQAALLQQVSGGVRAFLDDIEAHGMTDRVIVLAWSEFGRRVEENGSRGTDHGSAQPMFIAGSPIKGGLYGGYPSLTDLDNKNLKMTTDFRSVYATILESWLGADPAQILKGSFPSLGFVA